MRKVKQWPRLTSSIYKKDVIMLEGSRKELEQRENNRPVSDESTNWEKAAHMTSKQHCKADNPDYDELSQDELILLAEKENINGFTIMCKAELIAALREEKQHEHK